MGRRPAGRRRGAVRRRWRFGRRLGRRAATRPPTSPATRPPTVRPRAAATRPPAVAAASTAAGGPAAAGAANKPCAAKSTAPGVTDDADHGRLDLVAVRAGPGHRRVGAPPPPAPTSPTVNANGGVCGRKIVLKEADDGTDNGRYRAVVSELGPQVLGLAGGFGGGRRRRRRRRSGSRSCPSSVSRAARAVADLPNVFDINPQVQERERGHRQVPLPQASRAAASVALVYLGDRPVPGRGSHAAQPHGGGRHQGRAPAGAADPDAELRLHRPQGRQQQGRLPVLHRRHRTATRRWRERWPTPATS